MIEALQRRLPRERAAGYVLAQVIGGIGGTVVAHGMFGLALLQRGTRGRSSGGELLGELVATFGLWLVIATVSRARTAAVPAAVALYIVAAYWFTSSTSFANPAVTIARAFTDSFAGIRPADVAPFVGMQMLGGALALGVTSWLLADPMRPFGDGSVSRSKGDLT